MSGKKVKGKVETYVTVRTPEQESYMLQVNAARKGVDAAKKKRDDLLKNCTHSIAYSIDTRWGEDWPEGDCWCDICDTHFGHYCPDSPDHGCHYFSKEGKIHLFDGRVVDKPRDPDVHPKDYELSDRYENDDACLFCGSPQERK